MFSNLYWAYETLSPGLQRICDQLTVMHASRGLYGADGGGGTGPRKPMPVEKFQISQEQVRAQLAAETPHPLVIRHPETGKKSLYITGPYCVRFKDMTDEESQPMIHYLQQHVSKPEFTCRFRWEKGSVALFDNRHCQHFAVQDYAGFRREMLRFEVAGGPLVGLEDPLPAPAAAVA
jgi:taurine dioxygenase